jgi:hypothetical protein
MPVPTHRYDCTTRMWETSCPDCDDTVYFFSCSCGSKVFFDLPEPPWDPHERRCIAYLAREMSSVEGVSLTEVRKRVDLVARARNRSVPKQARRMLAKLANGETGGTTVLRITPGEEGFKGETLVVTGTVHGVQEVNMYRRTGFYPSPIGKGLLGDLGKQPVVELFIRGERDPETGFVDEFAILAYEKAWRGSGLRQRVRVRVEVMQHEQATVSDSVRVWLAKKIEPAHR